RQAHAKVALQLVEAAVHVDAWILRIVALPNGDGRAPKTIARNGPVPGPLQPLAELSVTDAFGDPVDLLVELDHAVAETRHLHVPRAHGLVDQRLIRSPAVRVVVIVRGVLEQDAALFEARDHRLVGVEHQRALPIGYFRREAA